MSTPACCWPRPRADRRPGAGAAGSGACDRRHPGDGRRRRAGSKALQAAQADGTPPAGPPTNAAAPELARNLFRREGEYWTVAYDGAVVRLRDAKGLRHLARLLAHPGREFHAVDLEAADRRRSAGGARGATGGGPANAS